MISGLQCGTDAAETSPGLEASILAWNLTLSPSQSGLPVPASGRQGQYSGKPQTNRRFGKFQVPLAVSVVRTWTQGRWHSFADQN